VLNNYPLMVRAISFIVLPVFLIFFATYYLYIASALPVLIGEQYVEGLNKSVKISRDEMGVVYIEASVDEDVYFAMGYAHAQDRLWQLELQRRLSQGRMAEIFGEKALNSDIWMRTLGIYDSAVQTKHNISDKARQSLEAYTRGINAWLHAGNKIPSEFDVFGISFENWKVEDSLAWQKVFSLNLAGNYGSELLKYIANQYLSASKFELLFGSHVSDSLEFSNLSPLSLQSLAKLAELQKDLVQNSKVGGKYVGSNAFVISGKHTKSGLPILANDPHLAIQIPSLWYAVSQKGDRLKSQGFSLVGLPLVIFGRNEYIAWGGTNMMADVQDLVIETLNPEDHDQYLYKNKWTNFDKRIEKVAVKAPFPSFLRTEYKPIEFVVRESENGPIISDAVPGFEQPVSLKWVTLSEIDKSYESFYLMNYASNLAEFRASFENYVSPALNLLYADSSNNIALLGIGKIPIRSKGDGTLPIAASESGKEWLGFVPYDEMPFVVNPKQGFIVNSNNSNIQSDYSYLISSEFAQPYRANRIARLLSDKIYNFGLLEIEDTFTIMSDVKDLSVEVLLNQLLKIEPINKRQEKVFYILKNWDFNVTENQVAPSIYYRWIRYIKESLLTDSYISSWNQQVHNNYMEEVNFMLTGKRLAELIQSDKHWCRLDKKTELVDCHRLVLDSLDEALNDLTKLGGGELENWQWGKLSTKVYSHNPFSNIDSIKSFFERKYASEGYVNTVNVSSGYFDESEGYVTNFGAGFRQAIELSKETGHYLMNSTGQSGHAISKHYDDMLIPFQRGKMHSLNSKPVASFYLRTIDK